MLVKGFGKCYPTAWHLGTLSILSGRSVGDWQVQEALSDLPSPCPPEAGRKTLMWDVPSPHPEGRKPYLHGGGTARRHELAKFPHLLLTSHALCYRLSPRLPTLHQNSRKTKTKSNFFNLITVSMETLMVNTMLHGEGLDIFHLRPGRQRWCSLSSLLSRITLEVAGNVIRQEK